MVLVLVVVVVVVVGGGGSGGGKLAIPPLEALRSAFKGRGILEIESI